MRWRDGGVGGRAVSPSDGSAAFERYLEEMNTQDCARAEDAADLLNPPADYLEELNPGGAALCARR